VLTTRLNCIARNPSRRLRPGQLDALKQSLLEVLHRELFAPGSTGEQLWQHGLSALIETPEAMEAYLHRAQGQDDAKRRAWLALLTWQGQVQRSGLCWAQTSPLST
jgi:hypothetical protein